MSCRTGTTTLTTSQSFYLRVTQLAFTMSQALSLRKLADLMHGTTSISQQPVWLLGEYYGTGEPAEAENPALDSESLEAMLTDFRSRLWLTYRKEFPSLGPSLLTSDVGWGCTIRSGQMLLAEAISRVALGRSWSRQTNMMDEVQPIVELFLDDPQVPLSIHRICEAGVLAGIVPGRWVGPWMLCKSLEALFTQLGEQRPMGLHLHVACGSGGGAPELDMSSIRAQMAAAASPLPQQQDKQQQMVASQASRGRVDSDGSAGPPSVVAGSSWQQLRQGDDADLQQEPAAGQSGVEASAEAAAASGGAGPASTSGEQGAGGGATAASQVEAEARGHTYSGGAGCTGVACPRASANRTSGYAATGVSEARAADAGASEGQQREQCGAACRTGEGRGQPTPAAAAARAASSGSYGDQSCSVAEECGASGRARVGDDAGDEEQAAAGPSGRTSATAPVLLLIPLTLGMDKINPVYVPQLQRILTWPQSVGIIGGRPGASLYLCGVQDTSFLYLDPHEVQPAVRPVSPSATAGPHASSALLPPPSMATYFCDVVRLLPATALDPSMAIGFMCTGPEDLEDLFSRLEALSQEHSGAPLMTLTTHRRAIAAARPEDDCEGSEAGARAAGEQQLEEWELV